jgi:hypothetical protein
MRSDYSAFKSRRKAERARASRTGASMRSHGIQEQTTADSTDFKDFPAGSRWQAQAVLGRTVELSCISYHQRRCGPCRESFISTSDQTTFYVHLTRSAGRDSDAQNRLQPIRVRRCSWPRARLPDWRRRHRRSKGQPGPSYTGDGRLRDSLSGELEMSPAGLAEVCRRPAGISYLDAPLRATLRIAVRMLRKLKDSVLSKASSGAFSPGNGSLFCLCV